MRTRRAWLGDLAALALAGGAVPGRAAAGILQRAIPASGETLPVIGLGSWLTFDEPGPGPRRDNCAGVMRAFFARGGRLLDSSPMYGAAQSVIGEALGRLDNDAGLFSATKVWVPGAAAGRMQADNALRTWGLPGFDLLQVHNLVDWEDHLPWLFEWQAQGRIRYTGVTTSHGRRHEELLEIIRTRPVAFVQFTYNLADREAERRLLPAAAEHGKAVIVNRPFQGGALFERVRGQRLPAVAADLGCTAWSQLMLKWVVGHPAVTCAIPATSQVGHLEENMAALAPPFPDARQREAILNAFERLAG